MKFLKLLGQGMMFGARAHAQWEIDVSNRVFGSRKRLLVLMLLMVPAVVGGIALADDLPDMLGGKTAYSPAFYTTTIFLASIAVGVVAGLITGCIGAGGGFIIAPALMSAGVKGILAVGTDLFHIFAKAIMGSVHPPQARQRLGGAGGGLPDRLRRRRHRRAAHQPDPLRASTRCCQRRLHHHDLRRCMLGFLGFYALADFLQVAQGRRRDAPTGRRRATAARRRRRTWATCPGSSRRSTSRP